MSYELTSDLLPTTAPHETAATTLPPAPGPVRTATLVADTHAVACAPLGWTLLPTLYCLVPKSPPLKLKLHPPGDCPFHPVTMVTTERPA